jgi:hypothetical protein
MALEFIAIPPLLPSSANFSTIYSSFTRTLNNSFEMVDMNLGNIINLAEPTENSDAATKFYVDTHGGGGGGDLTGPISSTSGVTSITAQTGIGTKFVVDDSPILITPTIGEATATSLDTVTIDMTGDLTITPSGKIQLYNTTNSTGFLTGSFFTAGGASISKDTYIGGTCYADEYFTTSDKILKTNIEDLKQSDISKFMKLKGYSYNLKNDPCLKYGVLAQELESVGLGLLVDNSSKHKRVAYQSFTPFIIEVLKNHETKFDNDNARLELLEQKIEKLLSEKDYSVAIRNKRRSNKRRHFKY